jgi:hypothetical protein
VVDGDNNVLKNTQDSPVSILPGYTDRRYPPVLRAISVNVSSQSTTILRTGLLSFKISRSEETSTLQMAVESLNNTDHADENGKWRGNSASGKTVGSDSNVTLLDGQHVLLGVARVPIHSQVASQGTAVDNVHDADTAMYCLSTYLVQDSAAKKGTARAPMEQAAFC